MHTHTHAQPQHPGAQDTPCQPVGALCSRSSHSSFRQQQPQRTGHGTWRHCTHMLRYPSQPHEASCMASIPHLQQPPLTAHAHTHTTPPSPITHTHARAPTHRKGGRTHVKKDWMYGRNSKTRRNVTRSTRSRRSVSQAASLVLPRQNKTHTSKSHGINNASLHHNESADTPQSQRPPTRSGNTHMKPDVGSPDKHSRVRAASSHFTSVSAN